MDKYIYDESNGLWYELQGDYYIPCLILSEEETQPMGFIAADRAKYPFIFYHYTTSCLWNKFVSCFNSALCFSAGNAFFTDVSNITTAINIAR